jgi:ribose transport system substrate-binding protein
MRIPRHARLTVLGAVVLAAAMLLAACGTTKSDTGGEEQSAEQAIAKSSGPQGRPTITEFCGEEPITVALVDGFGGNAWRKTLRAEYEEEAAKCDNIEEVLYFDANGDPQKYISGVEGLVAKGANVIITFDDFGSATLGALRKATQAGVEVVPYNADPGGTVGTDYVDFISVDYRALSKEWVAWMNQVLNGKGKLLFVGGPAGNPQDTKWLEAVKENLKKHPGLELAQNTFLATEFTPESVQQAVSGAISKYGDIDGYFSSYGAAMSGAIRAYENAGKPVPAIATVASSNELGCLWQESSPPFPLLSLDETPELARIALRKGVAAEEKVEDPEPSGYQVQPFMDTENGKEPQCNKELPPDADLSSSLTPEELAALFR